MSGYVKAFEIKDKNNKLMYFCKDDENLLEKNKTVGIKIEYLKSIELNALPVDNDRYIKTKIRTWHDRFYTKFHGLNVPEDDIECESFTVIPVVSCIVSKNKYYLQVYFDNCTFKIPDK